jgi:opacity protein-like surface antigen
MNKLLLAGAVLVLSAPAAAAFADDGRWRSHRSDHREHRHFHRDYERDHREAHRDGFYSRRDHRAYHRDYRRDHRDFHDDHPRTRHDHGDGYRGGYRYAPTYGYDDGYARPYRRW